MTGTSVIGLYELNDTITAELASWGWSAETEEDYDALNDLTLDVYSMIETFAAEVAR